MRDYLEDLRWPDGPECPRCESKKASRMASVSSGSAAPAATNIRSRGGDAVPRLAPVPVEVVPGDLPRQSRRRGSARSDAAHPRHEVVQDCLVPLAPHPRRDGQWRQGGTARRDRRGRRDLDRRAPHEVQARGRSSGRWSWAPYSATAAFASASARQPTASPCTASSTRSSRTRPKRSSPTPGRPTRASETTTLATDRQPLPRGMGAWERSHADD